MQVTFQDLLRSTSDIKLQSTLGKLIVARGTLSRAFLVIACAVSVWAPQALVIVIRRRPVGASQVSANSVDD
jgi:hypothetical protein